MYLGSHLITHTHIPNVKGKTTSILVENLVRISKLTWGRFPKYGTRTSNHKRNTLIN